ncbi:MAG TPA: T9SS type A sorting domain-containing protein [Chryseolinea sp.]|nr:T9SS type A sorting domain-containing protein [Chryseolinea sp.]
MTKHLRSVINIISAVFISIPSFSQEILVKDINTEPAGLAPANVYSENFCKCGDYLFFSVPGKELWRTDGTAEGTISLGDLRKGLFEGFSGGMACADNNTLYFEASDGQRGWELWTTDGTKTGTKMVKDATPGNNDNWGVFIPFGLIGNTYYFLNDHDNNRVLDLWKSNGTESTTVTIPGFPAFSYVFHVGKSDTHHFFRGTNSVTQKEELWATDGTNIAKVLEGYTVFVTESIGPNVMFVAHNTADNTYSLWSSNGTDIGTYKVKDFDFRYLSSLKRFNDKLIFGVQGETWISDGTDAGTISLTTGYVDASVTIGNDLYGFGYDFSTGSHRLIKTDGNVVETFNMSSSGPGSLLMFHQIPQLGDGLYLQYSEDGVGQEVGVFNINSESFHLVKDINPGANGSWPRAWARLHDKIYFLADDGINGMEVWSTDGSAEGTSMLKHIVTETGNAFRSIYFSPIELVIGNNNLQLLVEPQATEHAIYTSDGTPEGTTSKFAFPFQGTLFGRINDELIYFSDRKFYKSNVTSNDVSLIKDVSADVSGHGYSATTYPALGDKLVFIFDTNYGNFSYGTEFWVTDGTDAGTHLLKDINPGLASGVSYEAALLGSKLVFQGTQPDTGSELWITDGTEAGTILLNDINPGATGSVPNGFATLGNKVIFGATESTYGGEVWITDGTPEGTKLLADIVPGATGSDARHFKAGANFVFFSAYDVENGWTVWRTDGTTEGTKKIIDVIPGNDKNNYPNMLSSVSDEFYFGANDEVHGQELWVTDGTTAGTHLIDVVPGAGGSNPSSITDIKGVAYFKADASLWRTNGTTPGTFKVSNLEPFKFVELNNWVYFTGFHPQYGVELFKVEFTKLAQEIVFDAIPDKTFGDPPFQIPALATSGLPITIASGDELTVTGSNATIVKPGTVKIVIRQEGDALFNAAEPVEHTFCIVPAKPTITVSTLNTGAPVLTSSANEGNQWFHNYDEIGNATEKTYVAEESCTFKVNVTIDGCTSEFSDDEIIVITGIEDVDDLVTLYPNPAQDYLKIQATASAGKIKVDILDVQGKAIEGFQVLPNELIVRSLEGYVPGVYLLKIDTDHGISYHKFVKE